MLVYLIFIGIFSFCAALCHLWETIMKSCFINTRIEIIHGVDAVQMVPSLVCTRRYVCRKSIIICVKCQISNMRNAVIYMYVYKCKMIRMYSSLIVNHKWQMFSRTKVEIYSLPIYCVHWLLVLVAQQTHQTFVFVGIIHVCIYSRFGMLLIASKVGLFYIKTHGSVPCGLRSQWATLWVYWQEDK